MKRCDNEDCIGSGVEPVLLKRQYRCHPILGTLASDLFYEGRLVNGVTVEQRRPLVKGWPALLFFDSSGAREEQLSSGSFANEQESRFVVVSKEGARERENDALHVCECTQMVVHGGQVSILKSVCLSVWTRAFARERAGPGVAAAEQWALRQRHRCDMSVQSASRSHPRGATDELHRSRQRQVCVSSRIATCH